MGEIADMTLEGMLCQGCGVVLGDGDGYPAFCSECQQEQGVNTYGDHVQPIKKVVCPRCKKKVRENGLAQHRFDMHREVDVGDEVKTARGWGLIVGTEDGALVVAFDRNTITVPMDAVIARRPSI